MEQMGLVSIEILFCPFLSKYETPLSSVNTIPFIKNALSHALLCQTTYRFLTCLFAPDEKKSYVMILGSYSIHVP